MGITRYSSAVGASILLMSFTASAKADPITTTYNITVTEHCTTDQCVPITLRFPLTMTFDSVIIRDEVFSTGRTVNYGPPTFSAIPFDRPAVLPGATEFRHTFDTSFLLGAAGLPPWRRVSSAEHSFQALTSDFDFRWHLSLFAAADTATRAELGAVSFAQFLAQGPEDGDPNRAGTFIFGFFGINRHNPSERAPESFSVTGFAELAADPAPVPEPATATLFGLAVAIAGVYHRRRKRS